MKLFKKKENLLAIDIGSSSVKMLVMEGTAKKVKTTFENSVSFRIEKNEEPEREKEIIASAIKECVASLNLKKYNKIIFSIPVQNVIARIITIAAVPLDKLDSIISYEAEQHIPFPLSEVAFKYQLISYDDENMEILLTAVKQDRLNDLM
ncbi:MAG TPA: pilus assembly protein PilM, partial [bacterium]|nr:pilus assembly protein PilM [bacterium]